MPGFYDSNGNWVTIDGDSSALPRGFVSPYSSSYSKCECGAEKTYGPEMALEAGFHSDWCPLYKQQEELKRVKAYARQNGG